MCLQNFADSADYEEVVNDVYMGLVLPRAQEMQHLSVSEHNGPLVS